MSRRRKPATPPAAPAGARRDPRGAFALVALVAVALALSLSQRGCRPQPAAPPAPVALDTRAVLDSILQAEARNDWVGGARLLQRIADSQPRNATVLMALGKEWSNVAWFGESVGRMRSAQRSSLDRVRLMRYALALEDSASRMAASPREAADVQVQWGRLLELMGMPIDALAHYSLAFAADSSDSEVREHIGATERSLHDPAYVPSGGSGGR